MTKKNLHLLKSHALLHKMSRASVAELVTIQAYAELSPILLDMPEVASVTEPLTFRIENKSNFVISCHQLRPPIHQVIVERSQQPGIQG
jgi:hypothetical protein